MSQGGKSHSGPRSIDAAEDVEPGNIATRGDRIADKAGKKGLAIDGTRY
jgi:hypothetical protein